MIPAVVAAAGLTPVDTGFVPCLWPVGPGRGHFVLVCTPGRAAVTW